MSDGLILDVRYALRMMRRSPAFAAAAIATLALGIGASASIFTVLDAVLLKRLPVAAPAELVLIDQTTERGEQRDASFPLFERLRSDPGLTGTPSGVLSGVVAVVDGTQRVDVARNGSPIGDAPAAMQLVDGGYFSMLGVRARLGRTLAAEDDGPRDPQVVVLSHRFWSRRLASDPEIVGSTIVVKKHAMTVVGVAPAEFFGESVGRAPDLWAPLAMQPRLDGQSYLDRANVGWLRVIGRVRPEIAGPARLSQVNAALDVVRARLQDDATSVGRYSRNIGLRAADGSRGLEAFRVRFALPLAILAGIVALVLIVACANVSNLLLARAMARHREIGVRFAIGAARARIVRQLLTESAVLGAIAGSLGLLLGMWGSRILLVLAAGEVSPSAADIPISTAIDGRAIVFTAGVSLLAVAIFGLAPAVMVSGVDVSASFKGTSADAPRPLLGRALVVAQVALSMILLTGAGLFLQTLHNLRTRDVGFAPDALIEVQVRPASPQPPDRFADLTRRLSDRLRTVPGVASASFAHAGFATGMSRTCCIAVQGYAHQPGEPREIRMLGVGPDYFKTMGLRLIEGRDFAIHEAVRDPNRLQVAIVNEAFVRRYLAGRSAIGARFGWGNPPNVTYALEIVGVARDAVYDGPREVSAPLVYFPSLSGDTLVVRAAGSPDAIASSLRREIDAVDNTLESNVRLMSSLLDAAVSRERLLSRLSSFFGIVAIALAAIGLYGVMSYGVARRTKEIGIRMALGADRGALLRSELRVAVAVAAIGVAAGIPLTTIAGSLVRSQLFGIQPADPITLGIAALLLTAVAAAAALAPARRASRVDPMTALRAE
jgi:predicted permease